MTAGRRGWTATALWTALLIFGSWVPLIMALEIEHARDGERFIFAFCCFSGLAVFVTTTSFALAVGASETISWALVGALAVVTLHACSAFGIHRAHAQATGGGRRRDSFRAAGRVFLATVRYSLLAVIVLVLVYGVFFAFTLPDLFVAWPFGAFLLGLFVARYWLALPAMAVEGIGCAAALRRSRILTAGVRVRIFGLAFLLVLATGGLLWGLVVGLMVRDRAPVEIPVTAVAAIGALVGAARVLLQSRLYHERVRAVDAPPVSELNRVFE